MMRVILKLGSKSSKIACKRSQTGRLSVGQRQGARGETPLTLGSAEACILNEFLFIE
jgi:hypothetical protein